MEEMKEVIVYLKNQVETLPDAEKAACLEMLKGTLMDLERSSSNPPFPLLNRDLSTHNTDLDDLPSDHSMTDTSISLLKTSSSGKQRQYSVTDDTLGTTGRGQSNLPTEQSVDLDQLLHLPVPRPTRAKRKRRCPMKLATDDSLLDKEQEQRTYSCVCCKAEYETWSELEYHLYGGHERILVTCLKCKGTFANQALLLSHECYSAGQKEFLRRQCGYCDVLLKSKHAFTKHKKNMHNILPPKSVTCNYCGVVLETKKELLRHIISSHANGKKVCEECGALFDTDEALYSHTEGFHMFSQKKCNHCGQSFPSEADRNRHMIEAHKHKCSKCDRIFVSFVALQKHSWGAHKLKVKNSDNPMSRHQCNECNRVFPRRNFLLAHCRLKHGLDPGTFPCRPCRAEFNSEAALRRHNSAQYHLLRTGQVRRERTNTCEMCGKSYLRRQALDRHIVGHYNCRFKCDYCDFHTIEKSNLDQHLDIHFEIKRFQCKECGQKFCAKRTLTDHVAFKHRNEKNFMCQECGMTFKTYGVLARHKKKHLGVKQFVCMCGMQFNRLSNMRRHMNRVHNDEVDSHITSTRNGGRKSLKREGTAQSIETPTSQPLSINALIGDQDSNSQPSAGQHLSSGAEFDNPNAALVIQSSPQILVLTGCHGDMKQQPILTSGSHVDDEMSEFSTNEIAGKSPLDHIWRPMDNPVSSSVSSAPVLTNYSPSVSVSDPGIGNSRVLSLDDVLWSSSAYTGSLSSLLGPPPQISCPGDSGQYSSGNRPLSPPGHLSSDMLLFQFIQQQPTQQHHSQQQHSNQQTGGQQCSDFSVGYLIGHHSNPGSQHSGLK